MPSVVSDILLKEVTKQVESVPYAFISSFSGIPVDRVSELRRNLAKCAKRSVVVKHSLATRAFASIKIEGLEKFFDGHVLVTMGEKDPQNISKALMDFAKTNEKFIPKAVVFERKLYDASFVKRLATLPSRHELLTQVVVRMKSPIAGFVITLNQVLRGLAVAINEIKKKKEAATAAA